jgi:putative peptidoglycan lipid II flippase
MRYFASGVHGAIFRINLARRLLLVPVAVLGQAAGQAALPFLARLHAEGKKDELGRRAGDALAAVWVLTALAGAWLVALAHPAVDFLYRRGGFGVADARATGAVLWIFGLAVPLWGAQAILSRAFYARQDTWVPMLAGTVVTALSVPLFWAGWRAFGAEGLAAASAIGMAGHVAALAFLLGRRVPGVVSVAVLGHAARGLLVAAAGGAAAWGAAYAASFALAPGHARSLLQLGAGSGALLPVALVAARLLQVPEVGDLVARATRRFARRKGP